MAYNKSLYIISQKMGHFYANPGHETEYNLLKDLYREIEKTILSAGGPEARHQIGEHIDFIEGYADCEGLQDDVRYSIELVKQYGDEHDKQILNELV